MWPIWHKNFSHLILGSANRMKKQDQNPVNKWMLCNFLKSLTGTGKFIMLLKIMSCQWPAVIRKGRPSSRATRLLSNPGAGVEILMLLCLGCLEPGYILTAPSGSWKALAMNARGAGTLCWLPVPPATVTRALSKGE